MGVAWPPAERPSNCPDSAAGRPVSGVRCVSNVARPVSTHAMSTRPLSNVRVWTSGARVGVRAFRVRVRRVCTRDFVECVERNMQ